MVEAVVVGGGLAGCAVAIPLAARGVAVNVVDLEAPGAAATGAAAGMLAPQYEAGGAGVWFDALLRSRDFFPGFASRIEASTGVRIDMRFDGMLVANLSEADHHAAEGSLEWQRAVGQEAYLLDRREALRLEPAITPGARSYLWLPREGQVDNQRLSEVLRAALEAAGVRVLAPRRVREVRLGESTVEGVVLGDDRLLRADVVVIAAGAWSGTIGGLPRTLPVRPVRGHLLRYPRGAAALDRLVANPHGRYLVPRADGTILAGSTMDESGFDRSIVETALATIHREAGLLLPALTRSAPAEHWADLRPISADGLPFLGADPDVEGLYYATGYGRNGILFSPLAGDRLAGLIVGDPLPSGWEAFSPLRIPRD
jgi:glycine oxidase